MVSSHREVIKLILMESQINPEVADFDYIKQIVSLLKNSIKEAGILLTDEEFSLRLLMGSILLFLYLPLDIEEIDNYVRKLVDNIIE